MATHWWKRLWLLGAALLLVAFGFVLGTSVLTSMATQPAGAPVAQAPVDAPAGDSGAVQPIPAANLPGPVAAAPARALTDQEQLFADIYARISPSVVAIDVLVSTGTQDEDAESEEDLQEGSGSGFVIDRQGHIVTNAHVVDGATRVAVNFFDGTIVRAEIVGVDLGADIAVLRVDLPAEQLIPVEFGDSDALVIGQTTLAIGSPFGQRWTMTTGIVSALDRTIFGLTNFSIGSVIQTDAAVNPGNSGGPLLNLDAQVIGVNSQIISQTRSNSGIAFAVPSNLVKRVATELITAGRVDYSFLGITGTEINLDVIENYDIPNNTRGAVVLEIVRNGPADRAGLRPATNSSIDIIIAIDGVPVTGMNSIISYLGSNTRPGDEVTLTVLRNGERLDIQVTLGSRPN